MAGKYPFHTPEKLYDGVWIIHDNDNGKSDFVDCYLIEGDDRALVIDAGFSPGLRAVVDDLTDKPLDLLITHAHPDHIVALDEFDGVYMSHLEIPAYLERYAGRFRKKPEDFRDITDGMVLDLGNRKLEMMILPGHTPGSVLVLDRANQLLYTSDALGTQTLWMHLPDSASLEEYLRHMDRLYAFIEGLDHLVVLGGHKCMSRMELTKAYIDDVYTAVSQVVSGERVGEYVEAIGPFPGRFITQGSLDKLCYNDQNIFAKK
jgi:glyoxylase-like metal-dependent hydrolase (beta-lactamase superfamily II)